MKLGPSTRTAAALALIGVTPLWLPLPITGLLVVALLAAVGVDAANARIAPRLEVRAPRILSRGVPSQLSVATHGGSERMRLRQPAPPEILLDPSEAGRSLAARVTGMRRGRYTLPAAAVRTEGPLGLVHGYHRGPTDTEILVYPDVHAAQRLMLSVRRGRFGAPGHVTSGPLGLGTDFESIRDYLPDDDIRQVNWRATARAGRPMSNQFRIEQDRDVICLVDCGRLMSAPLGNRTRLDAALDAVASVAMVADEIGDRCGAVAFETAVLRNMKPSRRGGHAVIKALFDLEPAIGDSDYERAFRTIGRGGKRALVFIFTDLVDRSAADALIRSVPVLSTHHAVIVASALDDDLAGIVSTPPKDRTDAFAMSVAVQILDEKERVAARIRHAGARVLEASHGRLGAACVGAYLRSKQRARL